MKTAKMMAIFFVCVFFCNNVFAQAPAQKEEGSWLGKAWDKFFSDDPEPAPAAAPPKATLTPQPQLQPAVPTPAAAPPTAPTQPKQPAAKPARQKVVERPVAVPLAAVDQNIPEWRMLDADLSGKNVAWRDSWLPQFGEAATALQRAGNLACLRVHPVEDIEVYRADKVKRFNCITDDMATCRASMTKERGDLAEAKLQELHVPAEQIKRGNSYTKTPLGQRGVILRLIENCIAPPPEPAQTAISCWDDNGNGECDDDEKGDDGQCTALDCQGAPGSVDVNIDYDLGYQGVFGDEGRLHSLFFRANWPATKDLYISAAVQYGSTEGLRSGGSAGAELSAEYRNSWVNPRVVLVGRALELDNRLAFERAEVGFGFGLLRSLYWPWLVGEIRGERKWIGEAPRPYYTEVNSLTAFVGVRFGGNEKAKEEKKEERP